MIDKTEQEEIALWLNNLKTAAELPLPLGTTRAIIAKLLGMWALRTEDVVVEEPT